MRAAARHPAKSKRQASGDNAADSRAHVQPNDPGRRSVFVSYSRHDIDVVRDLVARLRVAGIAVTWDQDFNGGADFELAIRTAIDTASSVIVVWSTESVQSSYVRDEARLARDAAKLVTTHAADFDFKAVPLGFGHLHAVPVDDTSLVLRSLSEHARTGSPTIDG